MSKRLAEAITATYQKPENWLELERNIEQMGWADFAVTYEGGTPYNEIPLLAIMGTTKKHLAELIIKKNPVFAAKIVDDRGCTALYHACGNFPQEEALKIINLLTPYMSSDTIVSRAFNHNTFLHLAIQYNYYKVAASISPELIGTIVKNSCADSSYIALLKFLKDAIHFYDSQISANSETADNHFRKGILLQALNKQEKAVKCYKKAIQLDSSYAEKVAEIMPVASFMETGSSSDNADPMKSKVAALTKEINNLNEKAASLSRELAKLTSSQKVVEEHKGERVDEVPPYEEPLPEEMALMGSIDTCDVTVHTLL